MHDTPRSTMTRVDTGPTPISRIMIVIRAILAIYGVEVVPDFHVYEVTHLPGYFEQAQPNPAATTQITQGNHS